MSQVVHILRYGTVAEKTYLEKAINTYDYLVINGNSAAYVSRAIAKFVVEKFFSKPEKGFFIDPITYAFQHNTKLLKTLSSDGSYMLKKSIKKLVEEYGPPVNKVEADTDIKPSDFSEARIKNDFCYRVLKFQYYIINDYINNNDLEKYLRYATGMNSNFIKQFYPKLLIAPYFYLNPNSADFEYWLDLNIQFIELSTKKFSSDFGNSPIFGQIVLNKNVLQDNVVMQKIANAYNQCTCIGFTVWVDGFDEHEEDLNTLNGFIEFLQLLKKQPVYSMYGGFFSVLLTHRSIGLLDGVSHGMEYGEHREVYPVGGGLPVSKYYYMPLHQRKDFTKAFLLLEHNNILDRTLSDWGNADKYYAEICKCPRCREIIEDAMINFVKFESDQHYEVKRKNGITRRKKASPKTKENCLYHYLLCKMTEFDIIKRNDIKSIIDMLQREKGIYITSNSLDINELAYIDKWCESILCFLSGIKAMK
jgi:hypothetical protein